MRTSNILNYREEEDEDFSDLFEGPGTFVSVELFLFWDERAELTNFGPNHLLF